MSLCLCAPSQSSKDDASCSAHVIVTLSDPSKSIVPRDVSPTLPVTHPCFHFLTLIASLAVPSFLVCEDSLRSLAPSRKY